MALPPHIRADIAHPGDPDLTLDLDNLLLTAVVAVDHELLLRCSGARGARGFWIDDDGRSEFGPGEGTVDDLQFRAGYGSQMTDDGFERLLAKLHRWRDNGVPLRMCVAPERLMLLIADNDAGAPLARCPA